MKVKSVLTAAMLTGIVLSAVATGPARGFFDASKARHTEKHQVPDNGIVTNHSRADQPVFSLRQRSAGTLREAGVRVKPQSAPAKVLGDGTTIYGSLIFSSDWTRAAYGIYSFPASAYSAPVCVVPVESYDANGGGTYADGKYYYNSFVYTDEMGYTFSTFCTYDFETDEWTRQTHGFLDQGFDQSQITTDMAYDPTSGLIYALSYIAVDVDGDGVIIKYYPALSTVDPDTGFVSPIARIPDMITLAVNQSGELYAISKGQDASLYRINKESGDCTLIGSTGLNTNFIQSMAFDPVTDRLYWAAVQTTGLSGLYEVDVTSGRASRICDFEANEEYAGLYIPEPEVATGAPAMVEDFKAVFVNDSHSGTVSLKVPGRTYGGSPLNGDVKVMLTVDGQTVLDENRAPASVVTVDVTLEEGIHNFTAVASNAGGAGPRIGMARYVGLDAPAQVENLKLEKNASGAAVVSWTAPQAGRNDGYVDASKLRYTVVRMPGNTLVADKISATSFTDPVNAATDNYRYVVTPWCDGREGISAETTSDIFGNGTTLPCKFDFATQEDFDLFTVIDANHDYEARYSWGAWLYGPAYSYVADEGPCAVYAYHPETAADDWLITPPFQVEKGKKYLLTYTLWTKGDKERMEVTAGTLNTIESQQVIIPATEYSHKDRVVYTQEFTASASGNYTVGFHVTSDKKRFYLFVTDIMVDEIPDDSAPAAVSGLEAVAGEKGKLEATLSFTVPSETIGGDALAGIDRVDVFRGNEPDACHSFPTPVCGSNLSWTDTRPFGGFNTYRVVPVAGGKAGEKAEVTIFVGYDLPKAPTDVKVTAEDGSQPVVTWTAPTEGQNGGYLNPDELVYAVYRLGDEQRLLSRNVSGTSFTDETLDGTRMQYYVGYQVVPVSVIGEGDYGLTDMIVFGDPYEGEFKESFADRAVSSNPWLMYTVRGRKNLWGLFSQGYSPICNAADGDYGLATFQSTYGSPGDEGRLVSPKLSVASLKAPVLSFYVYLNASEEALYGDGIFGDRLVPEVRLPDGTFEALGEPIYVDNTEGAGWLKFSYDLSAYKQKEYFQLSFHGIGDYGQDINLDLIRITNRIDNDLRAYTFTGPAAVRAGEDGAYRLTVYNAGANTASGYKVALRRNGVIVDELSGLPVVPGAYVTYELGACFDTEEEGRTYALQGVIEWDSDEIPGNNLSETVSTMVSAPLLPEVYKLDAVVEESVNVRLGWDKPSALRVIDSFEDYAAFSISDIGDYRLVDGDKGYTYGFSDIYFDNTGAQQSFMVFNPVSLGIVLESTLFPDAFDPHSGKQVLACFQAVDPDELAPMTNDDWLISPEVFGGQTVRFYAKAGDVMQGVDKFEVLYSSTDRSTSSFIALSQVISTDENWTLHEFTLPENARYFALHCKSDDGFVLYIDDLSFIGHYTVSPVEHVGYRVYRDDVAVADLPATATGYLDAAVPEGVHVYRVGALYDGSRESALTEACEVTVGNVGIGAAETIQTSVKVVDGVIEVRCPADRKVIVAGMDGVTLYAAAGRELHEVSLLQGVYLVSAGNTTYKVVVR